MHLTSNNLQTIIPTKIVGPIKIIDPAFVAEIKIPLATFEKPLWSSVARGARVTKKSGGIKTLVISDNMTRSIILQAQDAFNANLLANNLEKHRLTLEKITLQSSKFAKLITWTTRIVANLIYIRLVFSTEEAAGHNMATRAAEHIQTWILRQYPQLKYISISGNYCVDKKNSAVNGILGRGKHVIAETLIPGDICKKYLNTTPQQLIELNIKKNLLGSIISGSVMSANAHFANMLLAIYLATGQDAANIIEGSQGFTYAEKKGNDLYFSVTLPNIIIGTIGNGKNFNFVKENLEMMGCINNTKFAAKRLAAVIAGGVLCGELSLLAAQTNPGELMRSHIILERKKTK